MEKLPEDFEERYLRLLQSEPSPETLRARRMLSSIAFLVIGARFIGLEIENLRVLGVDFSAGESGTILLLLLIVLAYQSIVFFLHAYRDEQFYSEQKLLLERLVNR